MKKLIALFMICCMITACGATEKPAAEQPAAEATVIAPLPTTVDVNALDNCTVAVSFEEGAAHVNDEGSMMLDVTVYTYDLYDMVDIAGLKAGDTIVIQGNEVAVETVETLASGLLLINGGMENGGYDFWHNDSGVYYEQGMNDAKSYYPVGEACVKVSADFEFKDSSDPANEVTYFPGDFLTEDAGIVYNFVPNNTSIVIEGGQVISMTRIFTP